MAAVEHNGIRAYAFQCTYPNGSTTWQDSATALIIAVQTALNSISNFAYSRLLVSNVRNSARKELEIEIDGITWLTKKKLTVIENDSLISALETALNSITNFTYNHINIVNDIFKDDPTTGWPGQSMKEG